MSNDPVYKTKARVRAEVPEQVDVAVVGAGLGGLVSSAYLAQAGFKVACFDQHYVAGGCATQFARGSGADKYQFDIGLHYIGDCHADGSIPRILRGLGLSQEYTQLDPDGFDTLVFPDLEFKIPNDLALYRARLVDLFPHERKGIDRYHRFLSQIAEVSRAMERRHGRMSLGIVWKVLKGGGLLMRYQNATMKDFLDDCIQDPKLRAVIMGQNGDYAIPPSEVSAFLHAGLAVHYFRGAYYPKGGGQIISDKIAECIENAGSTVHLRKPVTNIAVEGAKVVGIDVDMGQGQSKRVQATKVISNADIKLTLLDLIGSEHLPGKVLQKTRDYRMAEAIFMTCLGVKTDLRQHGMRSANYWQFDGYDFEALYKELRTSPTIVPRAAYITSASLKDPECSYHAPEGVQTVEIMTMVSGDQGKWRVHPSEIDDWRYKKKEEYLSIKQAVEANMIDRLEALFPGTKDAVVFQESATPTTHRRYTRSAGGTGYGIAASPQQFMNNRPGYRGPLKNLYLCGASTRAGHGIVGAMSSGFLAATCLAKDAGKAIPSVLS
jgi:all-trans-retinol 13,14-reductase